MADRTPIREVVFVGGTGRSGTHVVARLLGRHSRFAAIPIECRFHVNPRGFPDLLAGRVGPEQFMHKLRKFWWHRIKAGEPLPALLPRVPMGRDVRGLHQVVSRKRFDEACERFEAGYAADHEEACRTLFWDLLGPLAEEVGKPALVEMSCFTVAQAPTLIRLFPQARVVHSVRDGRDAGVSKTHKRQKREHPQDAAQGIDWWLGRLEEAEAGVRDLAPEMFLTLSLDELVEQDREPTYAALLQFLGIEDEAPMRELFDTEVTAANAHRGRWREGLSAAEQERIDARYQQALAKIEGHGYTTAAALRRVYEHGDEH